MDANEAHVTMSGREVEQLDYTVTRLTVPVPDALEFKRSYEAAVPDLPLDAVRKLVGRRAPWSEMERLIGDAAPFGFLIYFRNAVGPVMALAGDHARCTGYLMGNHVIAERMFRYDPRAMMYAPLHTVIWEDHDGKAWFTVDQPSAQFGSSPTTHLAAWSTIAVGSHTKNRRRRRTTSRVTQEKPGAGSHDLTRVKRF